MILITNIQFNKNFKLENGVRIDDYMFIGINKDRYYFVCLKCGKIKSVSKNTVKMRNSSWSFNHRTCKN